MSDLIRTLRDIGPSTGVGILIDEAADQLEANAALIALLRASLRKVEDEVEGLSVITDAQVDAACNAYIREGGTLHEVMRAVISAARQAALANKKED